jgi:hypothetical protein
MQMEQQACIVPLMPQKIQQQQTLNTAQVTQDFNKE